MVKFHQVGLLKHGDLMNVPLGSLTMRQWVHQRLISQSLLFEVTQLAPPWGLFSSMH